MRVAAIGVMPRGSQKDRMAGTATPMTAMTEPRSMWTIIEIATMMRAMTIMPPATLEGRKLAIQAFMPVVPPTLPMAMAAVRKTRTCRGTAPQSLGPLRSPMMGMARSMPMPRVIQPMSMPWMESVAHRTTAMMTQMAVLRSTGPMGPISASFLAISSLLTEYSFVGLNMTRKRTRVSTEAMMAGMPM